MIYLTAGIIDEYDNPKVELECAATKAYSQELLWNVASFALNLIGMPATVVGHPIEQEIKNALHLQNCRETSGALKQYIGSVGLRYCFVSCTVNFNIQFTRIMNFFCSIVIHVGYYWRSSAKLRFILYKMGTYNACR